VGLEADILRDWIDRMRSGGDEQAQAELRTGDALCALGVLADIHPDLQWYWDPRMQDALGHEGAWWVQDKAANEPETHRAYHNTSLPATFLERLGISPGLCREVSMASDGGMTLPRVADLVEHDTRRWLGIRW
jgi:hypothetical protein